MTLGTPDYPMPRVGWRVWDVVEVEGTLRLSSLVYRTIWQPGSELAACCRRSLAALPWARMPLHGPPNHDCLCGIYAVATPAQALQYLTCRLERGNGPRQRVIGLVSLWGRLVESERGWRATYGYPALLVVPRRGRRSGIPRRWLPGPSAEAIRAALAAYAVPVEVVDDVTPGSLTSLGRGTVIG